MMPVGSIERERGAVALITTVVISILLTIIVTGLVSLMSSELRQASNAEQSTRALYAAQAGVEDGLQYVLAQLAAGSSNVSRGCTSQNLLSQVDWTCARVIQFDSPEGNLEVSDKPIQVDLDGAPTFTRMVLNWDLTPYPQPANFYTFSTGHPSAAPVEVTIVDYQTAAYASGATAQSDIKTQNVLIYPSTGAATTLNLGALSGNNPAYGQCSPTALSYHCSITIGNFNTASRKYILRLRTRYTGTSYKLDFYNGATPVAVPDGTATVDVTAKAGDVYRRVIYKVPIIDGGAAGLDYVIFSDNNDCKNYSLIAGSPVGVYPCPQL